MDASRQVAGPEGAPLALFRSWVYDPAASVRARGFATATVLVYPGVVLVEPRSLPAGLGEVPAARYAWPSIVVQRIVWSYRVMFPGKAAILLDLDGELGSASVPFGSRRTVTGTLRVAGFDVVEDVVRGWETPHPLLRRDHPELGGRVPPAVLVDRSWWPDRPQSKPRDQDIT